MTILNPTLSFGYIYPAAETINYHALLSAPIPVWDGDTSDASPDFTSITFNINTPVGSYLYVEFSYDDFATIEETAVPIALTENQINNVDPIVLTMNDLVNGTPKARAYTKDPTNTVRNSEISAPVSITINASSGISYVGSDQANATSITIPAHQAGDVIIITAFRNNATAPTIPGTFTSVYSAGASGVSISVGRLVATGSSEVSGTWTNASTLHVAVYRGCNTTTPIGVQQARNASDLSMEWGGLTGMDAGADSWVLGAGANAVGEVTGLPTDQTSRQATTGAVDCRTWDSNGPLASYAQQVTNFPVGRVWRNVVYELLAA